MITRLFFNQSAVASIDFFLLAASIFLSNKTDAQNRQQIDLTHHS